MNLRHLWGFVVDFRVSCRFLRVLPVILGTSLAGKNGQLVGQSVGKVGSVLVLCGEAGLLAGESRFKGGETLADVNGEVELVG